MINEQIALTVLPDGNGGFTPCPSLLTEPEIILFLRIPEVTTAKDNRNVVANLRRMHDLPCINICRQPLYPREAIRMQCLECWGYVKAETAACDNYACPLFAYRPDQKLPKSPTKGFGGSNTHENQEREV